MSRASTAPGSCFRSAKRFQNGNAGYDLAAYIVQVVTGQPFEQYLARNLFTPLGMSRSHQSIERYYQRHHTRRGSYDGHCQNARGIATPGSAGVYSTARDLARFVQLQLGRGRFRGPCP